jgi:hypothetical protein
MSLFQMGENIFGRVGCFLRIVGSHGILKALEDVCEFDILFVGILRWHGFSRNSLLYSSSVQTAFLGNPVKPMD